MLAGRNRKIKYSVSNKSHSILRIITLKCNSNKSKATINKCTYPISNDTLLLLWPVPPRSDF